MGWHHSTSRSLAFRPYNEYLRGLLLLLTVFLAAGCYGVSSAPRSLPAFEATIPSEHGCGEASQAKVCVAVNIRNTEDFPVSGSCFVRVYSRDGDQKEVVVGPRRLAGGETITVDAVVDDLTADRIQRIGTECVDTS